MGFHEVQFPTNVDRGSAFGTGFNTSILELDSGAEEILARWSGAGKHRFNAAYTIKKPADYYAVKAFYIARGGPANGFRYKDWVDYATTSTGSVHRAGDASITDADTLIGAGTGAQTEYQLLKTYSSGGITISRTVTKPVSGTVVVAVDGVSQTLGADFTVDTTTGLITFTTVPGNNLDITVGFEFDVPVRFGREIDFTMPIIADGFDWSSIGEIPLVEQINPVADPEIDWNGGAQDFGSVAVAQTISLLSGKALRFDPSVTVDIIFPDATAIEPGGPIFAIKNDNGTFALTLKYDDAATTIGTVVAGAFAELWLLENATSGLKEWQLK